LDASVRQGQSVNVTVPFSFGPNATFAVLSVQQQPPHGAVSVANNAVVVFVSNPLFFGIEQIVLQVCDSLNVCSTSLLVVTVVAVPPQAAADTLTVAQGATSAVQLNVLANDVLGAAPLSSVVVTSPPAHGTAVASLTNMVFYLPSSPCWNGADSFAYTITDLSNQTSVILFVCLFVCF
jgi:hypothetical protein